MAVQFINAPDPDLGRISPSSTSKANLGGNIFSRLAGDAVGGALSAGIGLGMQRLLSPNYRDLAQQQGLVPKDYKGPLQEPAYQSLDTNKRAMDIANLPPKVNPTPYVVENFPTTKAKVDAFGNPVFTTSGGKQVPIMETTQGPASFNPVTNQATPLTTPAALPRVTADMGDLKGAAAKQKGGPQAKSGQILPGGMPMVLGQMTPEEQQRMIIQGREINIQNALAGKPVNPTELDIMFGGVPNFNRAVEERRQQLATPAVPSALNGY